MSKQDEVPYKIYLAEHEAPTAWYNMRADMKQKPAPILNPGTGKPVTPGGAVERAHILGRETGLDRMRQGIRQLS